MKGLKYAKAHKDFNENQWKKSIMAWQIQVWNVWVQLLGKWEEELKKDASFSVTWWRVCSGLVLVILPELLGLWMLEITNRFPDWEWSYFQEW